MVKKLKEQKASPYREWYNEWIENNDLESVLDVGKSTFWDYGFDTIDINKKLNPTIVGDICKSGLPSALYDTVLCNGMYEFVDDTQKMINECLRIAKKRVIFGFVGKEYKPYKKKWKYFDFKEGIPIDYLKTFNKEYYFIICKNIDYQLSYPAIEILI